MPGKLELIDPLALWHSLDAKTQERLGALAIAHELAVEGTSMSSSADARYWAFEHTSHETSAELSDLITENLPDAFTADGMPKRPDLNVLSISQCTSCGYTGHFCFEDHILDTALCPSCQPLHQLPAA